MSKIYNVQEFVSAPIMSGASIATGTIPIIAVVGTAMDLTTTQTVGGVKTFSSAPVMSGASITSGTIPAASVVGTAATLAATQTLAGVNTFSGNVVMSSGLQFTTGATNGYVMTSDASGNLSLQAVSSSGTTATVATTDATPTTLASIAIGTSSVATIYGRVSAANAAYTDATGGEFVVTAYRAGGSAALSGTPYVIVNASGTALFNVVLSGNNVIVQVTGIAATTYNWKVNYVSILN